MKENITFGECLSNILTAIDLKSSRLAREINIDSSLVYKWLRNERIPPIESTYINLIIKSIEKRLTYSAQRDALISILDTQGSSRYEASDSYILNQLKLCLQNAQSYSIRLHNERKSQNKLHSSKISVIADYMDNINELKPTSACGNLDCEMVECPEENNLELENYTCGHDHVHMIKGNREVLSSAIKLLQQAIHHPSHEGTILITFNSDFNLLLGENNFSHIWIDTLYHLLRKGWDIIFKIRLDSSISRTIRIIEYIQMLLSVGNVSIYYDKLPAEYMFGTELCIVPKTGALFSFSTSMNNQVDNGFLFHSKNSINMLSDRFFYELNSSKPLMKAYPSQIHSEFQQAFADSEEDPGDKYVFKRGLSTISIPMDLYEKYLNLSSKTDYDASYRLFLHRRRVDAFENQVKYFKFKDICLIESLYDLVNKQQYSYDENYMFGGNLPDRQDIITHLEYLITLLKKYNNYDLAVISQSHFSNIANINWMVKGKNKVMIEIFKNDRIDNRDHKELNFIITEKNVASAFHDYFYILWDSIPEANKNKKNIIAQLKSLIKICKQEMPPID